MRACWVPIKKPKGVEYSAYDSLDWDGHAKETTLLKCWYSITWRVTQMHSEYQNQQLAWKNTISCCIPAFPNLLEAPDYRYALLTHSAVGVGNTHDAYGLSAVSCSQHLPFMWRLDPLRRVFCVEDFQAIDAGPRDTVPCFPIDYRLLERANRKAKANFIRFTLNGFLGDILEFEHVIKMTMTSQKFHIF